MFMGFKEGITFVKMKKLGRKKKLLAFSWERPFLFVNYLDKNEFLDHDEGGRICVIKGKDDQFWDRPGRDPQMFHTPHEM
jgi:hypothetical protein